MIHVVAYYIITPKLEHELQFSEFGLYMHSHNWVLIVYIIYIYLRLYKSYIYINIFIYMYIYIYIYICVCYEDPFNGFLTRRCYWTIELKLS